MVFSCFLFESIHSGDILEGSFVVVSMNQAKVLD